MFIAYAGVCVCVRARVCYICTESMMLCPLNTTTTKQLRVCLCCLSAACVVLSSFDLTCPEVSLSPSELQSTERGRCLIHMTLSKFLDWNKRLRTHLEFVLWFSPNLWAQGDLKTNFKTDPIHKFPLTWTQQCAVFKYLTIQIMV